MPGRTLKEAIALNQVALSAMLKGDCSGYVALLSNRDDVSWGNPFGPFSIGRENVETTLAAAAARMQGGSTSEPNRIAIYQADGIATVVEVERGDGTAGPFELRVTSVYREEDLDWKLVHRHADPISTPR